MGIMDVEMWIHFLYTFKVIPTPKEEIKKIDNITLHICELVTEKRRARSRWQRSRNNDDRLINNRLR
jgi:hypothetical protein